jgi:uncharacterized protein (TIGR03000 family)
MGSMALFVLALAITSLAAQTSDVPADAALLKVKLPEKAKLFIGDQPTATSGKDRTFRSPTLEAGKKYTYVLKAIWEEGGKTVTEEQTIEVERGKLASVVFPAPKAPATAKSREFFFTYRAIVTGLEPGKKARVWLPVATTSDDQEVKLVSEEAGGAVGSIAREPKYGNQVYSVEVEPKQDGNAVVAIVYRVKRMEVRGESKVTDADREQDALFLKPDALVPTGGKPATLIEGKSLPSDQVGLGRALYDVVNGHMRYSKDQPGWGKGDANWACDSRFGNCTDFHSLFISLARTKNVPAKFEMGFSIPEKRGQGEIAGYHCWAKFKPAGRGWIPVDISEADKNPSMTEYYFGNLTEDRVAFSVGRDIDLTPRQAGPALNFFIYPYVEVDGQSYAADKVKRQFSYEDVGAAP